MTFVTLFTDASFDHKRHTAGWGAWARTDAKRVYNGGGVNHTVKDSNEAELIAVWEGIAMLKRSYMIEDGDDILIQTDNVRAATSLPLWWPYEQRYKGPTGYHTQPKARTYHERRIREAIFAFCQEYPGIRLMGRHVKGHSNDGEKRSFVNNLCDDLATRGRIRAQQKLANEGFPKDHDVQLFPILLYPMERVDIMKPRAVRQSIPSTPIIDFREL